MNFESFFSHVWNVLRLQSIFTSQDTFISISTQSLCTTAT